MDVECLDAADGGFAFDVPRWRGGRRRREAEGCNEGGGVGENFSGVDETEAVARGVWGEVSSDLLL